MKLADLFEVMSETQDVRIECYGTDGQIVETYDDEVLYVRNDCADILDCQVCGVFSDGGGYILIHVDL